MKSSNCSRPSELLRKQAMRGDCQAQFELGWRYYLGDGVPFSLAQAERWWHTAALQGHQVARSELLLLFGCPTAGGCMVRIKPCGC